MSKSTISTHSRLGIVSRNVREIRARKRLTVKQLAERAGLSSGAISSIELNRRSYVLKNTVWKVAKGLGVPYEHLYYHVNERSRNGHSRTVNSGKVIAKPPKQLRLHKPQPKPEVKIDPRLSEDYKDDIMPNDFFKEDSQSIKEYILQSNLDTAKAKVKITAIGFIVMTILAFAILIFD